MLSQEMVLQMIHHKTATCLYLLVFVPIKQTRYNVIICERYITC